MAAPSRAAAWWAPTALVINGGVLTSPIATTSQMHKLSGCHWHPASRRDEPDRRDEQGILGGPDQRQHDLRRRDRRGGGALRRPGRDRPGARLPTRCTATAPTPTTGAAAAGRRTSKAGGGLVRCTPAPCCWTGACWLTAWTASRRAAGRARGRVLVEVGTLGRGGQNPRLRRQ